MCIPQKCREARVLVHCDPCYTRRAFHLQGGAKLSDGTGQFRAVEMCLKIVLDKERPCNELTILVPVWQGLKGTTSNPAATLDTE